LDEKIVAVANESAAAKNVSKEHEEIVQVTLGDILEKQKSNQSGGSGSGGGSGSRRVLDNANVDRMDVDEPMEPVKGKNRKCVFNLEPRPVLLLMVFPSFS